MNQRTNLMVCAVATMTVAGLAGCGSNDQEDDPVTTSPSSSPTAADYYSTDPALLADTLGCLAGSIVTAPSDPALKAGELGFGIAQMKCDVNVDSGRASIEVNTYASQSDVQSTVAMGAMMATETTSDKIAVGNGVTVWSSDPSAVEDAADALHIEVKSMGDYAP